MESGSMLVLNFNTKNMKTIKELEKRKKQLEFEMQYLHCSNVSTEMYRERKNELEYEIALIDQAIEVEKGIRPMLITLVAFCVIALAMIIFIIAQYQNN